MTAGRASASLAGTAMLFSYSVILLASSEESMGEFSLW
jgi:hypothetical protein